MNSNGLPDVPDQLLGGASKIRPPNPGQNEPWMLMAIYNTESEIISPRNFSANPAEEASRNDSNSGVTESNASTQPVLTTCTNTRQTAGLQLSGPIPNTRTTRMRTQDSILDLEQIKNLSLSDQQQLIQNPKVTKLDLRDQIYLHQVLMDSLVKEYRSKIEDLGFCGDDGKNQAVAQKNKNVSPDGVARYQCLVEGCEKDFSRDRDRERHRRTVHANEGTGPNRAPRRGYACLEPGCERRNLSFSRKDNATAHGLNSADAARLVGEVPVSGADQKTSITHAQLIAARGVHGSGFRDGEIHVAPPNFTDFSAGLGNALNMEPVHQELWSTTGGDIYCGRVQRGVDFNTIAVSGSQIILPPQEYNHASTQFSQDLGDIGLQMYGQLRPFIGEEFVGGLTDVAGCEVASNFQGANEGVGEILIGYARPGAQDA
ncbi:hypothetical protein TWF718_006594 [Orbilia javanica]|uniref:C2H2-type domain-containing protein n=1 Tax=Orbilia javanica TaxID=47235 RepID=A0AAN8RCK2_9PEZI